MIHTYQLNKSLILKINNDKLCEQPVEKGKLIHRGLPYEEFEEIQQKGST